MRKLLPPRFRDLTDEEISKLKVKIVTLESNTFKEYIFNNLDTAAKMFDLQPLMGAMADKYQGEWCIRFETQTVSDIMSN